MLLPVYMMDGLKAGRWRVAVDVDGLFGGGALGAIGVKELKDGDVVCCMDAWDGVQEAFGGNEDQQ